MSEDFNHIHSMSKSFTPRLQNLQVTCFLIGSILVTSNLFWEIQVPCINSILVVQVVGNDVDMSQHVLRTLTSIWHASGYDSEMIKMPVQNQVRIRSESVYNVLLVVRSTSTSVSTWITCSTCNLQFHWSTTALLVVTGLNGSISAMWHVSISSSSTWSLIWSVQKQASSNKLGLLVERASWWDLVDVLLIKNLEAQLELEVKIDCLF